MLVGEQESDGVAICWPRKSKMIASILRSGRCPSWGVPKQLRVPGGLVALVDPNGDVLLVFRIARIETGVEVTAANGKRYERGCVLIARKGSVRRPGLRDPRVLSVKWHAPGALAYFDATTRKRIIYDPSAREPSVDPTLATSPASFPARRYPFFTNNIGKTLSQPERELIRAYVTWLGDVRMVEHHALKETGLFTDLFIPRCWTLIEAKTSISRPVLREAVGQLFDYQRHYDRSPRLAVLLPEKPPRNVMGLFEKKRIVVIWKSLRGSFHDSADGSLTTQLRSTAR